jgi:hypothetical protein
MRSRAFQYVSLSFAVLVACGDSGSSSNTGGSDTGASGPGGSGPTAGGGGSGAGTTDGGGPGSGAGGTGSGAGGTGAGGPCPSEVITGTLDMTECDLYLQDCPVATDTCDLFVLQDDSFATQCTTRNGLKSMGESCTMPDDCGQKLTCAAGVCTPFCCPEDPNSCGGGTCSVSINVTGPNGETDIVFQACAFSDSCEFFNPDSCGDEENCYFQDPGVAQCFAPADGPGNEVQDGQPCMFANDCLDSAICISIDNGPDACRFFCIGNSNDPPGLGGCPAGPLCNTNSFDSGFANVGICVP